MAANIIKCNLLEVEKINGEAWPPSGEGIVISEQDSTPGDFYPVFASDLNISTTNLGSSSKIKYTPETGVLNVGTVTGTNGILINNTAGSGDGNAILMNNIEGIIIESSGTGDAGDIVLVNTAGNYIGLYTPLLNIGDSSETTQYSLPTSAPAGTGYVLQSTSGGAGATVTWQALAPSVSVFRVTINNFYWADSGTSAAITSNFNITLAVTGNHCVLTIPAATTTTPLNGNPSFLTNAAIVLPLQYMPYACVTYAQDYSVPALVRSTATNQLEGITCLNINHTTRALSIQGFSAIGGNTQSTGLNLVDDNVFVPAQSFAWDLASSLTTTETAIEIKNPELVAEAQTMIDDLVLVD